MTIGKNHKLFVLTLLCIFAMAPSVLHALSPSAHNPINVRFVTFNIDFNKSNAVNRADVLLVEPKADIMMFQEAKFRTIDNYLGPEWTVYQVTTEGDAKRGSALAWRNSFVSLYLASGLELGVPKGSSTNILDRWIAWADLQLTNGQIIRIMSLHMPPKANIELQPPMATNIVNFVNRTPYPVVVGGDWNYTVNNDIYDIEGRTGLIATGVRIDGFYYEPDAVTITNKFELAGLGTASDHNPIQIVTKVYNINSSVQDWALYY